jgi:DNA-binding XRE family transcriptional regulator
MTKTHSNVQIIKDAVGKPVAAVLPWAEYERLKADSDETAALIAAGEAARGDYTFPSDIAKRLARGESPLKVLREWRDLTQAQLGANADVAPVYISQLERGTRNMGRAVAKKLAPALGLPANVLLDF